MKHILAVALIIMSGAAFAVPEGCNPNANFNARVACNDNLVVPQEIATVPLPGTVALMALGLTGLIISRRRR